MAFQIMFGESSAVLWRRRSFDNCSDLDEPGREEAPVSGGQSSAASVSSTSSQEDSSQASAVPGETIDMPNLVGENFEDAQKAAQENGKYQVLMSTEEFNDTVAEGHIISQVPEYAEGEKLPEGSVIAVIVSKGPREPASACDRRS